MKQTFAKGGPLFKYIDVNKNSVLQLIIFLAVCFILIQAVNIVLIIVLDYGGQTLSTVTVPNLAIKDWSHFLQKPWVLLSYSIGHAGFFTLLSNMIWLYVFGNLIQVLIGYKEIIPLYIITTILSAIIYLVATAFLPNAATYYILSSLSGVVGIAFGALALSPTYRLYLGERFSFPLWSLMIVFLLLSSVLMSSTGSLSWILYLSSAAIGYGYIYLVKSGYKIGSHFYNAYFSLINKMTPRDDHPTYDWPLDKLKNASIQNNANQSEIDKILDKINEKGMGSLTKKEKQLLFEQKDK